MPVLAASGARPRLTGFECCMRQRRVCRVTQRTRGRRYTVWLDIEQRGDLR